MVEIDITHVHRKALEHLDAAFPAEAGPSGNNALCRGEALPVF
jgi:hypothetical protein